TLDAPGIVATGVTAGSCVPHNTAGTSERNYASVCGVGTPGPDVTFKFTWNAGATGGLAGQTFQGGGATNLTTTKCATQFPATADQVFAISQLVSAKLSYDGTQCQAPGHHSSPFNFRACTDTEIRDPNAPVAATCQKVHGNPQEATVPNLLQLHKVTAST